MQFMRCLIMYLFSSSGILSLIKILCVRLMVVRVSVRTSLRSTLGYKFRG